MSIINRPLLDGPEHQTPRRIVVHAMAEFIDFSRSREPKWKKLGVMHAADYLEHVGLSAHILVLPDGDRMRCREDYQGAWHALGFNDDSLGIEFLLPGRHDYASFVSGIRKDWLHEWQMQTGIVQLKEWVSEHDITDIDRHSDLSPERKVDPGSGFPWLELMGAIGYSKNINNQD